MKGERKMKKTILAGALSIACFTGGFATQAQAQGNANIANIIHPNQVVVATNQVQSMSYQDIYKMLLLSELGIDNPDNMTVVTTKNSITLKVSLKAVMDSYSDGTNLYPEGEKEFKENYEEIKKLFGDAMQMRFIQSGNSYKAEVYAEGKWQTASNKDVNDWLTVLNRADFDLKPGGYFTDAIGHWAESYIQLLYQAGIVTGVTDTTFNPNGQVTRGQLAAMIFRASGLDVNKDYEGPATYKDMQGFWGAKEVAILQEYGLLEIFDGDNFEPNKPATREEMAHVTASYLESVKFDVEKANKNNTFTDKGDMRQEAVASIGLLQQLGIIEGANGKFNPKGNLTRAQFTKILSLTLMTVNK